MKTFVVGLFVTIYALALVFAVTGTDVARGLFPGWFLLWSPIWLARDLEYETAQTRPEMPDWRTAAAPMVWAMCGGSVVLALGAVPTASEGLRGVTPVLTGEDAFVLVLGFVMAGYALAVVSRPAHWVVRWNAERAERLVRTEAALARARARVLQSQMQPHFLFNALNSVTALLRDDPARAKAVLVSLKGLMERSLETSHEPMTSVRKEVAFVRDQLAIELERFHDRLRVSFDVPNSLLDERIPAFSLQPLAENALRHGIAQSIDGGEVAVKVAKEGEDLVLTVDNTGAELRPGWQEGTGLGNLRARLDARYGRKADLSISQEGDRTRAVIRISPEPFRPLPSSKPQEVLTR
jgi:two-component system LytT family sensor kinase